MSLIPFEQMSSSTREMGGKAWGLAVLAKAGFPVPEGLILTSQLDEQMETELLNWWKNQAHTPLAVRSSASAEDTAETSFAGQNKSFLNVTNKDELLKSILACFDSSHREASEAYRKHFIGDLSTASEMNVVIQKMVDPEFAGVYFSQDPRDGKGWILEVIQGLGEDLVSGQKTPGQVRENGSSQNLPKNFSISKAQEIAAIGEKVALYLKFPVDMEWAVDSKGQIFVLQARPITTLKKNLDKKIISEEFARLKKNCTATTTWDGQTFAEWNGLPTPLTLSLWQKAFSPHHAFGDALKKLGYESFNPDFPQNDSLLENIFGRGYINLERMTDLYYGPMPYTIIAHPRPHTRFDYKKITWTMILHLPMALWSMIKVAWNVSSKRKEWIRQSTEALQAQRLRMIRPLQPSLYTGLSDEELFRLLRNECESFTKEILYWPLLMVVLTESTIQNLRLILSGIFGSDATDRKIRDWMAHGLHTVTLDMSNEMQAAADKIQQANFLSKYGHRGAGEMDLANPRWIELGEKSFQNPSVAKKYSSSSIENEVEIEIQNLKTFKRDIVLDEWKIFKKLLELREQWKMEILKPYAEIRFLLEEIGKRSGLNSDIHWLKIDEVFEMKSSNLNPFQEKIQLRKTKAKVFRSYSLPETLSLEELENAIEGRQLTSTNGFIGEALSPGVSYGEIRFVSDPTQVDLATWPEQVIIAAQATDPGWTPLFLKAKGIIVERGGVLSHCAIVAREMSIPAISGILNIQSRFKDGDRVWIDGNTGRISKEGVQR